MASIHRTKFRVGQVTGSLGTHIEGGIVDTQGNQSAANLLAVTLPSGSLSGLLSEALSSIKRLHGGATFANNAAGTFYQDLTIAGTTPKLTIGDAGTEDASLVFDGNEQDFYVGLDDGTNKLQLGLGAAVGTTPNMELNSADRDVKFFGDVEVAGGKVTLTNGSTIDSETDGVLLLTEDVVKASANLEVGGHIVGDADEAKNIFAATTTASNLITIGGGGKVKLGGDLQIVGTDIDVDGASALTIGASVGANAITLGASNATVIIPGNLTVQGTTARVDTTNLIVKDPIVMLGSGAIGPNQEGGIAIASGSNTASNAMVFGRVANDVWGVGKKDVIDGTVTSLADMTLTAIRAADLEIVDATNKFSISSSDLLATVAQDFVVDAARDIILDAAGNDIFFKSAGTTIGTITNSSSDLVIKQDVNAKDIIFQQDDGNEIVRLGNDRKLYFFDKGGEHISSDGSVLTVAGGEVIVDSAAGVTLDAASNTVSLTSGGTVVGEFGMLSSDLYISSSVSNKDMIFMVNDGGVMTEVIRLDGADASFRMANGKKLELSATAGAGTLLSDATDAQFTSSGNLKIESTVNEAAAVYIHANGGTSEQVLVHANQGTGNDSVKLLSDAGGVSLGAGKDSAIAIHLDSASGITIEGGDQNDSITFASSSLKLKGISPPTTTTDKLYNVDGSVFWNGAPLAVSRKAIVQVGAYIASGTAISSDGSNSDLTPLLGNIGGLNLENLANGPVQVDLFVNGQLLLSGSSAQVGTGAADYALFHTGSAKFGFSLEADDVITFYRR
jgi:hypothetical protein